MKVTVRFRDSTRADVVLDDNGGSRHPHVSFQGVFVLVTDKWGEVTSYPADLIEAVVQEAPPRSSW